MLPSERSDGGDSLSAIMRSPLVPKPYWNRKLRKIEWIKDYTLINKGMRRPHAGVGGERPPEDHEDQESEGFEQQSHIEIREPDEVDLSNSNAPS